jgi:Domain of unknown function (DUF5655)
MVAVKSWEEMRAWQIELLERSTGKGLDSWKKRIANSGLGAKDEADLRAWLKERGVGGYAQMLLVHETFGYPEFLLKGADQLVDEQYADRQNLRPILDAVLAVVSGFDDLTIQARKTYVSLVGPRRTFAIVQATTKKRVDLGLRLDGVQPGGRLLAAKSLGNETINVRVALTDPDEVDAEVRRLLKKAYSNQAAGA